MKHASRVDEALSRAVLYRLASHAFRDPPPSWPAEWDAIARGAGSALEELGDGPESDRLCDAFDALAGRALGLEELQTAHARLFGHTLRAAVVPYETEWDPAAGQILQAHLLADLAAFYRAFGLELAPCGERVDHLSVELSFLQFLAVKEALAAERGQGELADVARDAERRFLAEHIGRWVPGLCRKLAMLDAQGFHGCAAEFLEQLLASESRRLDARAAPVAELPRESALALEDCCMGCDHEASCLEVHRAFDFARGAESRGDPP